MIDTRPRSAERAAALLGFMQATATTVADADPIRIAGVDYLGDLPTRVTERNGLFEAEGIDATVEYGASGRDNLQNLRAGETDFALMALTPIAIDLADDMDPREPDDPVIPASLVHSTRLNQVVALDGGPATPVEERGR